MSGISQLLFAISAGSASGDINDGASISLSASAADPADALATLQFNTNGTITITADSSTPASLNWLNSAPQTGAGTGIWVAFEITSSSGVATVSGGLTAGTRYEITADRIWGFSKIAVGSATRTCTAKFYNASSGGSLLGTMNLDGYSLTVT